ncbi:GGDEF domain-containing protein [Edaphobacillus lindanitolerans]|uniref:Diguanylate cyclase (GGDEF) domain-containing protein n=1 Tax=Edaphobacillus lindanitolerans TaxID=550447 RepID=A0A1U7PM39_9BACI|nr:sensor domain-containing diguanylate cyclase [Edaphobacillus lindanitolerans]SIT83293.1 diguanylate cyclase (GGDEF) domain-containing protein [Edaphobacillus lindanitolerans]
MDISKRERILVPAAWGLIVPAGFAFIVMEDGFGVTPADWPAFAGLAFLAVVTALYPLSFKSITVSFQGWLLIPIFLQFGLGPEIVVSQLITITTIMAAKGSIPAIHRFLINSLIFFASSVIAAGAFFLAGGSIGMLEPLQVLLLTGLYAAVYMVINHLCLYVDSLLSGRFYRFRSIETFWDFGSMLVIYPFGAAAYFLEMKYGIAGVLTLAIPFFVALVFASKYNTTELINRRLASASEIGYELADRLSQGELMELFTERLCEMEGADAVYVVESAGGRLVPVCAYEDGHHTSVPRLFSLDTGGARGAGLDRSDVRQYGLSKDWQRDLPIRMPDWMESIMTAPIRRDEGQTGWVIVGSHRRNAFSREDRPILELICTHFRVSLEKAQFLETALTESERCALTGLYNFRWFEKELNRRMSLVSGGALSRLSLIMLDIDHFKKLNDTYGHQSGNDILKGLAGILERECTGQGSVARFGGEEFVILLPGWLKDETRNFAEHLRRYIEQSVFEINPDLGMERKPVFVSITVSIGVATAPEDTDEALGLLRNADRALYVGGKQAGRNRVGVYGT